MTNFSQNIKMVQKSKCRTMKAHIIVLSVNILFIPQTEFLFFTFLVLWGANSSIIFQNQFLAYVIFSWGTCHA